MKFKEKMSERKVWKSLQNTCIACMGFKGTIWGGRTILHSLLLGSLIGVALKRIISLPFSLNVGEMDF